MKRIFVVLLLVSLLGGAALWPLWFAIGAPAEGVHLIVNEHEVNLSHLGGWHAAATSLAVLLGLCIVALALPLTLVLGVLLPLLLALGAVLLVCAAALGVGALALSPLVLPLLPLLLLWWLWRCSRRAASVASRTGGTTIDA